MIDDPIHPLVYKVVVILVHLMQTSNSGFVMIGDSVRVFEHLLTAGMESVLLSAMSVALMIHHKLIETGLTLRLLIG